MKGHPGLGPGPGGQRSCWVSPPPPRPYLHLGLLPGVQADGLDLADLGDVAVDPGAAEADEHPEGVGGPVRIWKAKASRSVAVVHGPGARLETPAPRGPSLASVPHLCSGGLAERTPRSPALCAPRRALCRPRWAPTPRPSALGRTLLNTTGTHRGRGGHWVTATPPRRLPRGSTWPAPPSGVWPCQLDHARRHAQGAASWRLLHRTGPTQTPEVQPCRANAAVPDGVRGSQAANAPAHAGPPGRAGWAMPPAHPRGHRVLSGAPRNLLPDRAGLTQHAQLRPPPGRASREPRGAGLHRPEPATVALRPEGQRGPTLQALRPEGPGVPALGGRIPPQSDWAGRWPCPHTSHHRPPLPS